MRKMISGTLLSILILFSGCIRSLHPIYTEKDLVLEPALIGQWSENDSKETWTFSRNDANAYTLVYTDDKGRQGRFEAHLAKLNGNLFLDLFPEEPELKENDFYKYHLLPVHTFLYVKQITPTLQMSLPEPVWLKKFLADNPKALRYEKIDDEIILTAETRDLQAFWLKHLKTEGAFGELSNMKRERPAISETLPDKLDAGDGR
jgi:hypothetical protein